MGGSDIKAPKRPEWVKCVKRAANGLTWCGETPKWGDWLFVNAEHAAESGAQENRLVACPRCATAIAGALGADEAVEIDPSDYPSMARIGQTALDVILPKLKAHWESGWSASMDPGLEYMTVEAGQAVAKLLQPKDSGDA